MRHSLFPTDGISRQVSETDLLPHPFLPPLVEAGASVTQVVVPVTEEGRTGGMLCFQGFLLELYYTTLYWQQCGDTYKNTLAIYIHVKQTRC